MILLADLNVLPLSDTTCVSRGEVFKTPDKGERVQIWHQIKVNSSRDTAHIKAQPHISSRKYYILISSTELLSSQCSTQDHQVSFLATRQPECPQLVLTATRQIKFLNGELSCLQEEQHKSWQLRISHTLVPHL